MFLLYGVSHVQIRSTKRGASPCTGTSAEVLPTRGVPSQNLGRCQTCWPLLLKEIVCVWIECWTTTLGQSLVLFKLLISLRQFRFKCHSNNLICRFQFILYIPNHAEPPFDYCSTTAFLVCSILTLQFHRILAKTHCSFDRSSVPQVAHCSLGGWLVGRGCGTPMGRGRGIPSFRCRERRLIFGGWSNTCYLTTGTLYNSGLCA